MKIRALTIGIIGYNSAEDLRLLLDAFTKLTPLQNVSIEILYVDDGSTDSSAQIFRNYNSAYKTKLICNKTTLGRAYSRNQIIKHALFDWVFFINSNILPKNTTFLSLLIKGLPKNGFAITNLIKYKSDDLIFQQFLNHSKRGLNQYNHFGLINYKYLLFGCCLINRATLVENSLFFDESITKYGGEELELSSRFNSGLSSRLYANKQALCFRNNHPGLLDHSKRLVAFGKYNFPKLSFNNKTAIVRSAYFIRYDFMFAPFIKGMFYLMLGFYRRGYIKSIKLIQLILLCSILVGYYNSQKFR